VTQVLHFLKIIVLLVGAALLLLGGGCVLVYLVLPFVHHGPDLVATNLTIASLAAVSLILGFALTYQASNSLRGRPSGAFHPRSPWLLVLLFLPCLILGQAMISLLPLPVFTSLAFPPFHIIAAIAPSLAILAFVGRRIKVGSWRTISLEVSHGAILAPLGALILEIAVLIIMAVGISFVVALTPGGIDRLMDLSDNLQDPAWLEDPTNLAELVLQPAVLIMIIVIFVIIAPLIEELLKGLGVLFLGYRLRGEAEAFLWGIACGAGFALGESLFNGSVALEGWWAVMILRWGATLMHCVGSGIMGLGWHDAIVTKRPWRLLGTYGASAGLHALWNGAAIAVAVPSLLIIVRPDDVIAQGVAGLIILVSLAFLLFLVTSMAILLFYLTRRASRLSSISVMVDEQDEFSGLVGDLEHLA
jgi:RsiW-degrading membrane proteinase PrsW (M82 family)